ncbi:MAG TPA: SUMF1/EgtB/PvdO family nonheme iron enzyme [Gaiellaceae bacterium]|nr:SUMF1/EgtB/PvdO family nonheme iron enzyme [Gaiellaceae bacterium]
MSAGLDPLVPRPIDLPTPIGGELDRAKIVAAPDDPTDWAAWREELARWRDRAREGYDGSAYERLEWTQGCFSVALVWLWDERLWDHEAGRFTPERLLDEGERDFGGYDGVVLWHAYPVIGIDERNQFDWYRRVPGLHDLVRALQARGVRVFCDYNPWDVGTRREPVSDAEAVASLVRDVGFDGVFLDTMKEAMPELRAALPTVAFEGESTLPLERIGDHHLSWAQWFADSAVPGVIRARWFEQRHMLHHTRRWNRSHAEELRSAWLNGVGMLVWESVFGSWVGWNERDRALLRGIVEVQRRHVRLLTHGEWTPLALRSEDASVVGSRWRLDGEELWALANLRGEPFAGDVSGVRVELAPLGLAAVTRGDVHAFGGGDATYPARGAVRAEPPVTRVDEVPDGFAAVEPRPLRARFRRRETGCYGEVPYVEEWKPLPPRLHDFVEVDRPAPRGPFAIAVREEPVTGLSLAEARAYAAERGARLPTEDEWQVAGEAGLLERRDPPVWNWTESEHSDGITRFAILKGGSAFRASGSEWYVDGGPQPPEFSLKYLLAGPLQSSERIGFRLAVDL